MIDIRLLNTVACAYDNTYHRFFLSRKRQAKSNLTETPKALSSSSISLEVRRVVSLSQRKSQAANFVQSY